MNAEVLGNFIRQCRHDLGLSQNELAEKLHVTAKAASRWERGVGFPDIKLLQPLADALGITIVELMQSKRIESDLPKEEAADLVSETVDTLRLQEKLSRGRDWITFSGSVLTMMAMMLVVLVSRIYRMEPKWVEFVVHMIGMNGGILGARTLRRIALPARYCGGGRCWLLCGSCLAPAGILLYAVWTLAEGTHWLELLFLTFLAVLAGFASMWSSRIIASSARISYED